MSAVLPSRASRCSTRSQSPFTDCAHVVNCSTQPYPSQATDALAQLTLSAMSPAKATAGHPAGRVRTNEMTMTPNTDGLRQPPSDLDKFIAHNGLVSPWIWSERQVAGGTRYIAGNVLLHANPDMADRVVCGTSSKAIAIIFLTFAAYIGSVTCMCSVSSTSSQFPDCNSRRLKRWPNL